MKNQYTIKRINSDIYTDEDWKAYFYFREKSAEIIKKELFFKTWQSLKDSTINYIKNGNGIYLVWLNQVEAGHFVLKNHFKDSADNKIVQFINALSNKNLNEDFIKKLYQATIEFNPDFDYLSIQSKDGDNSFIAKNYEAIVGEHIEDFELVIKDANLALINRWVKNYNATLSEFRVEFYDYIPDEILNEYCAVFEELLDDMPKTRSIVEFRVNPYIMDQNQKDSKRNNKCSYRYLVFDKNDKLMAKTNVFIDLNNPKEVKQYMTGVLKPYRGKGFGKWMKGLMYNKLVEDFPTLEKIITDVTIVNKPSRELSKQMGFKKTGDTIDYLIARNKLTELFERKSSR